MFLKLSVAFTAMDNAVNQVRRALPKKPRTTPLPDNTKDVPAMVMKHNGRGAAALEAK